MTTDQAEQIIVNYYGDDTDGLNSDLKLYAEDGYSSLQEIAQDILDHEDD